MKKKALLLMLVLMAGCRTKPALQNFSKQTFPEISSSNTVGIGEQMLTQGDAVTTDALVMSNSVKIGEVLVEAGSYPLVSENGEYKQFQNVNFIKAGRQRKNGKLYLFKKDVGSRNVCLSRSLCAMADYSLGKTTTYSPSQSQQTLIYSGKIGNKITLGYREFTNAMAKPAFSNDVGYDLLESAVLGYKGARIEVISATNTEITYKVVAGFN